MHDLVFGLHPVEETLRGDVSRVLEVLVDAAAGPAARALAEQAKGVRLAVRVLPPQAFRDLAKGRPFQGIAARLRPFEYADPDEVIRSAASDPRGLLIALDQVQDPQNLGSILRTAAFFGVRGVLLPKDRSVTVTPAVLRASAGAASVVPVAQVTNLARTVRQCNDAGFKTIGAATRDGADPATVGLDGPALLVMGSEAEGMRRLVRESCQVLVTIPNPGAFESLNVGVAAGILVAALRASGRRVVPG